MLTLYLFIAGLVAGGYGALLGLGGGVILIPILTILFHIPIKSAIGISLVGVIATSTGAAIVYVREGKANIRLGMTLEIGTTIGAIIGAMIAGYVHSQVLFFLFALLMGYNSGSMFRKLRSERVDAEETAVTLDDSSGVDKIKNMPLGMFFSVVAGVLSGLLGIGGGLIKIPVMYNLMGVPLKTAAATSNFMIGVTAAASAFIYFLSGKIDIALTVPVTLGIFLGATLGTKLNARISTKMLKWIFIVVFLYVAGEMVYKGVGA